MTPEAAPALVPLAPGAQARWLRAADGVRLRGLFWPQVAGAGTRGTVLILPGRTEHAEKYAATAGALARLGFAAAALDWRGQGLADGLLADPRKGHVRDFAEYAQDLAALVAALPAAGLRGPYFLLGHSMGGAIGLRALIDGIAGTAICAAAFSAPMWGIRMPGGRDAMFRALTGIACRAGLAGRYAPPPASGPVCYVATAPFEGNTLTTDRAEWDMMQADLRRHPQVQIAGPTLGWLHAALEECHALSLCASPAVPVLTAIGSDESIVDPHAVTARMARWPGGRLMTLAGARHEILMEAAPLREAFLTAVAAHFAAARPRSAA